MCFGQLQKLPRVTDKGCSRDWGVPSGEADFSTDFEQVFGWALGWATRGYFFLYPDGHFGLVPLTFLVNFPLTQEIEIDFLGVAALAGTFFIGWAAVS